MGIGRLIAVVVLCIGSAVTTVKAESQEARALWVTRFDYDSEAKIARIMEVAGKANFNIVYFQVRAAADAYYRSDIEPCAARLCGKLGGTPSYDPLEVAVREGHKHGLQVHAYLNALTGRAAGIEQCTPMPQPAPGNPRHVLLDHPEWIMTDRRGKRPAPRDPWRTQALMKLSRTERRGLSRFRSTSTTLCHVPSSGSPP